ncbi:MAG: (deoxy)nucleoside triphosphate pyrophosphohydrolase [Steroidobacteraceae bacterium]
MSLDDPRPVVHVVAAAVMDASERVLIAQRPAGTHLAGGWEFPGGKLEPGEERSAGLARELREELGITLATPRPLIRVRHAYPSREIFLDVWIVRRYRGEPRGLDGQALRWCTREELAKVELLPADGPIVRALWLPERLTQVCSAYYRVGASSSIAHASVRHAANDTRLRGVYCATAAEAMHAAGAGADFLVMREALENGELAALCGSVAVPVFARGLALERAWALGASGLNEIDE